MDKKRMALANFNIVFWSIEEEKPMLEYFDKIIYPALTSGITKKNKDAEYLLTNVEVIDLGGEEYSLIGNIVKKTTLEVFSNIDEKGALIETDNTYPAAPFSSFCIYLKNHRMVFVQNQKGSPTLKNFKSTMLYMINKYVKNFNATVDKETEEELPLPIINIVGIPVEKNIKEALAGVSKINKLTLKFYPLNGDIDFSNMFGGMTNELRKTVGSKDGEIILKTPESVDGIVEVLEEAGGTVEPIFNVTYPNKSKATISNDTISERMEIEVSGNNIAEELLDISKKGQKMNAMTYMNEDHNTIYNSNKGKIIPFVNRKL